MPVTFLMTDVHVVGEFKYLEVDDGDSNSPEFEYLVGRWRYRSLTGQMVDQRSEDTPKLTGTALWSMCVQASPADVHGVIVVVGCQTRM